MTNKIHLAITAVLLVVVGFVLFGKADVAPSLGAAGQTQSGHAFFGDGVTIGGTVFSTTSTAATYTVTATELSRTPQVIQWLPNVNTTLSISATSTFAYVPNIGDTAEVYFRNASSTDAATITFAAAGDGTDLQMAEATGGDLVLNGEDWAKITLIRGSRNLVTVIFDEMIEGD